MDSFSRRISFINYQYLLGRIGIGIGIGIGAANVCLSFLHILLECTKGAEPLLCWVDARTLSAWPVCGDMPVEKNGADERST
jgi:hypothetical protein